MPVSILSTTVRNLGANNSQGEFSFKVDMIIADPSPSGEIEAMENISFCVHIRAQENAPLVEIQHIALKRLRELIGPEMTRLARLEGPRY